MRAEPARADPTPADAVLVRRESRAVAVALTAFVAVLVGAVLLVASWGAVVTTVGSAFVVVGLVGLVAGTCTVLRRRRRPA
ncbi:hypothetical protein [Curtobacterium sp. RRHDQ10]|uniref:hypothetical protein n=1 Tax=Curtobacterium phyllosphaerae TaxID=3413379 RepID=UPI003BF3EC53